MSNISLSDIFKHAQDEKVWTALNTVNRRGRIFWCVEAIFLSVALSVVSIVWVGEPSATAPDGIASLYGSGKIGSSVQALLFNWPFAFLTAPLAATVGAWEVALALQLIADRYDERQATYAPVAKYILAFEIIGIVDCFGALVTGYLPGGMWSLRSSFLNFILFPVPLIAIGATALAVPCCSTFTSRDISKAAVGFGFAILISIGANTCHLIAASREYSGGAMPAGDVIVHVSLVIFALVMCKYTLAAVKESLSEPSEFNMLGWGLKRALSATPASSTDAYNGGPTVAGIVFFVICMNTRIYFVWVVCIAIKEGEVTL